MNIKLFYGGIFRRFIRFKLKTFMMMLGVIVGVFTLTSGMALGGGIRTAVLDFFNKSFLPNSITVASSNNVAGSRGIQESDIAMLLREVPGIAGWTPVVPAGAQNLVHNGKTQRSVLIGQGPDAPAVIGQTAVLGEHLSDEDVRTKSRVVLLGATVREELFGTDSPVDQELNIGSQVFQVKGVLSSLGADPHGGDLDNIIVIPYTTLLQTNKRDNLVSVRFRMNGADMVETGAALMRSLLRAEHNLVSGQPDDFTVSTSPAGQAAFQQMEGMFKLLLPVITGIIFLISLLVIASIMMISVKERTAEIGLRKAVGARTEDLEFQFQIETILLALIGGLFGILLSYPGLWYIQGIYAAAGSAASFLPSPLILALSLASAALTGVLAAWWPARRAAALSPVEALR